MAWWKLAGCRQQDRVDHKATPTTPLYLLTGGATKHVQMWKTDVIHDKDIVGGIAWMHCIYLLYNCTH